MSNWLEPVGPHASKVYWRRRAVVLVLVLAMLWLATRSCGAEEGPKLRTGNSLAAPLPSATRTTPPPTFPASLLPTTPAPTSTATGTGTPTPTATTAAPLPVCARTAVQVTVRADKRRYDAKTKPRFTLTVTNAGRVACRFDVGARAVSFVVVSGKDRIWSSDDCERGARSQVRVLKPRQSVAQAVVWNWQRSRPGCPSGLASARPGMYLVGGAVSGVEPERKAVIELR